jgi:hypothetical protein
MRNGWGPGVVVVVALTALMGTAGGCATGAYYATVRDTNVVAVPLEGLRQAARDTAEQLVTADWPWRIDTDDGDRLIVLHLGQDMYRTQITLTFYDEGAQRSSFEAEGGFKREGALQTRGAATADRRAASARYCRAFVADVKRRLQK